MDRNIFLLKDVNTTGPRDSVFTNNETKSFQLIGKTTSGVGAVSVDVEVSNDNVNFLLSGTISLVLGTAPTTDGFAVDADWAYARGNVTSISGTGAIVSLIMGI